MSRWGRREASASGWSCSSPASARARSTPSWSSPSPLCTSIVVWIVPATGTAPSTERRSSCAPARISGSRASSSPPGSSPRGCRNGAEVGMNGPPISGPQPPEGSGTGGRCGNGATGPSAWKGPPIQRPGSSSTLGLRSRRTNSPPGSSARTAAPGSTCEARSCSQAWRRAASAAARRSAATTRAASAIVLVRRRWASASGPTQVTAAAVSRSRPISSRRRSAFSCRRSASSARASGSHPQKMFMARP